MALDDFATSPTPGEQLTTEVRHRIISETGLECRQPVAEGYSGNEWQLSGVVLDDEKTPQGYFVVPKLSASPAQATYESELQRAFVIAAEFRKEQVPGAVIVPNRRSEGDTDWEQLFDSVDCMLLEESELHEFIDEL
jgi:hypothetical protein